MTPVGLEPTTVARAGELMAETLGLRWPADRHAIVGHINDFRDYLYIAFPELHLFDNVFHCISVATFPERCTVGCGNPSTYQGFVLPEDVMSLEAAFEYGDSLLLRSHWRASHFGVDSSSLPRVEVEEMAEQTCTERPLIGPCGLKVFSDHRDDTGMEVVVEATMADGSGKRLRFALLDDGWSVIPQSVIAILSVSLPAGRKGHITLSQTDGRELSVYAPHEVAPLYRKFRIARSRRCGSILIQGNKRFVPVSCDTDVVEVGSRTVLKAAGSMLKFRSNTTDTADLRRAGYDENRLREALVGLHARSRGGASQDGPVPSGPVNTRRILPGYAQ